MLCLLAASKMAKGEGSLSRIITLQTDGVFRFLAFVDLLGTTYSASTLATGYGSHIAQPLLRTAVEGKEDTLTEEEALKIIEQSMKVLYYRDARSIDKVHGLHLSALRTIDRISCSTKWRRLQHQGHRSLSPVIWRRRGLLRKASEGTALRRNDHFLVLYHIVGFLTKTTISLYFELLSIILIPPSLSLIPFLNHAIELGRCI
jgi:hypothetical protein